MTESFRNRLEKELKSRREENLYRKIQVCRDDRLNLSGNDYLQLRRHPQILAKGREMADAYGSGSGASPLLSGFLPCHEELIDKLLAWKKKRFGMLFNTGFMANQAVLRHLPGRDDIILADKLIHHSMAQALERGQTRFKRYGHLALDQLEEFLAKYHKDFDTVFVVTESVFSMDGDYPDLKRLAGLKKKYPFVLVLDEAHGTGVFGETGAGLAEAEGVQDQVDILVGTLGKSLAGMGAYVLTDSRAVIDYLVNRAGEFIYSTFLPPYQAGVALASIEIVRRANQERSDLKALSRWFRSELSDDGHEIEDYDTPIVPIRVGEAEAAIELQELCFKNSILVGAVRPPTVPRGTSRLRVSLNSKLTREQLAPFIKIYKEWKKR
ncbi:hypothetical protein UR09_05225 [Candidatus Nitromaritima sp. SCGC AAA799-A02]|nr:hypothetical protein UR09_05225 [Candidatus Nitromaritima sp. SCGC AAA799-A02]